MAFIRAHSDDTIESQPDCPMTDAAALVSFHEWLFEAIDRTLVWPAEEKPRHDKRVGQAKEFVMRTIAEMGARGFLFDEPTVRRNVSKMLTDVSARQKAGQLRGPLYPYFRAVCRSYVDSNADRLSSDSKRNGRHVSQFVPKVGETLPLPKLAFMEMEARLDTMKLRKQLKEERGRRRQIA